MTEFWQNMTARERVLVSAVGVLALLVLALLVLGYFVLVRPLMAFEAESVRSLARAQSVYQQIADGAAAVEAARGSQPGRTGDDTSLRLAVAQTARETGVVISRLQPGADDALTVWVENVPSPILYRWLEALGSSHGIAPGKVVAQKTVTDGQLRVQLEFGAV